MGQDGYCTAHRVINIGLRQEQEPLVYACVCVCACVFVGHFDLIPATVANRMDGN